MPRITRKGIRNSNVEIRNKLEHPNLRNDQNGNLFPIFIAEYLFLFRASCFGFRVCVSVLCPIRVISVIRGSNFGCDGAALGNPRLNFISASAAVRSRKEESPARGVFPQMATDFLPRQDYLQI